jgi:hypothetical protein
MERASSKATKQSPITTFDQRSINWKVGLWQDDALVESVAKTGWLDYINLNVFGKSLFQPEYRIIKTAFELKLPKEFIVQLFSLRDEITQRNVDP